MTFTKIQLETLTKLYDGMKTEELKKAINHYEKEIEYTQAKVDLMNVIIYQRDQSTRL